MIPNNYTPLVGYRAPPRAVVCLPPGSTQAQSLSGEPWYKTAGIVIPVLPAVNHKIFHFP